MTLWVLASREREAASHVQHGLATEMDVAAALALLYPKGQCG
jgi:hypothetical protein